MKITNDIIYVGVYDETIRVFEGQYHTPCGMAYNSYVILDEKIAVMDSVDIAFGDTWIENIKAAAGGRAPDYLIVQHMEPDHSASITKFTKAFPEAKIVSSAKSFVMMKNFFDTDFSHVSVVVKEGDTLSLGKHALHFIGAPMVHWPEVLVTYDEADKILFSADGFGRFGDTSEEADWADEARRYYIGIVGKYGTQVQGLLKKAAGLEIAKICPLHGPVLNKNLKYYLNLYNLWSSYTPEESGVVIAYTTIYGNTKKAALMLADALRAGGCPSVKVHDLGKCDQAEAVADAFRYSTLVLASPTYNNGVFPYMRSYLGSLSERGFCRRRIAFIENGSWAPVATKVMKEALASCRDLDFAATEVKILSGLNEDSVASIKALAGELIS